jgi:hypothetical protein
MTVKEQSMIKKRYEVIKIEKLSAFRYLILLKPEKMMDMEVVCDKKPETDEDKYVLRMVESLVKYNVMQVSQLKNSTEPVGKPVYLDNDLEFIVDTLNFSVGDIVELTVEKVDIHV